MGRLKRILAWTNSPHTSTGYGTQIRSLTTYLQDAGYEVAIAANSGIGDQALSWQGIDVYPNRGDPFNAKLVKEYADYFEADVILTLYDLWGFPARVREELGYPWIAWTPVDGHPVPDLQIRACKQSDWIVSMSKFGKAELEDVGLPSEYIPLGVDCDVFSPGDREAARKEVDVPKGAFVVGVVAANKGWPCRKSWPELIAGFAEFHRMHPNDTILYLHTTRMPYGAREGMPIARMCARAGIPMNAIRIVSEADIALGIPAETMAQIYRSFDVLLSPSMGEGFGLPIVEAQACGTPVITQACSAMTEHTWAGMAIQPLQEFYAMPLDYYWYTASIPRITEALEWAYRLDDPRLVMQASHKVRQNYHWPDLFERKWIPFLERVEKELW